MVIETRTAVLWMRSMDTANCQLQKLESRMSMAPRCGPRTGAEFGALERSGRWSVRALERCSCRWKLTQQKEKRVAMWHGHYNVETRGGRARAQIHCAYTRCFIFPLKYMPECVVICNFIHLFLIYSRSGPGIVDTVGHRIASPAGGGLTGRRRNDRKECIFVCICTCTVGTVQVQ